MDLRRGASHPVESRNGCGDSRTIVAPERAHRTTAKTGGRRARTALHAHHAERRGDGALVMDGRGRGGVECRTDPER